MQSIRSDKHGRRLPDTGHGCGCELCAVTNAPRYERRVDGRSVENWSPLRRRIFRIARTFSSLGRRQPA